MKLLEQTDKVRCDTETEAKAYMENVQAQAAPQNYTIKKSGYEYKTKKQKGEIVDEAYLVSITKVYNNIWEESYD